MKLLQKNICAMIEEKDVSKKDFKDWIMKKPLCNDSVGLNDMKKWVKYRACEYPDADCVLKINDVYGCILQKLGWYNVTINKKEMYVDCIFSMSIFYNAFLRLYAPEYLAYGQLIDNFDKIFSGEMRNKFCDRMNINQDDLSLLFAQLNRFSRNTHTIGNYMPCPDNRYNFLKGRVYPFKDRIELLYKELTKPMKSEYIDENTRDIWLDWFDKNKSILHLDLIFKEVKLLEFLFNKKIMVVEDIAPYTNYLTTVNDIIENRGSMLMQSLYENSHSLRVTI